MIAFVIILLAAIGLGSILSPESAMKAFGEKVEREPDWEDGI